MKNIILILSFTFLLCSCTNQKYTNEYFDVFDTYTTLTIYTDSNSKFNVISNELHEELLSLNKRFDIYNDYEGINNIKTINDNAGIKPVKVDKETLELIKAGKDAYTKTQGTVNIALGSVLKIWHNYRENALDNGIAEIPSVEQLKEANNHTNINSIIINEENSTVYINDKETSIDVGAIAKGYAADYAAEFLRNKGVKVALLNLGGNVITLNDKTKESWKTGIVSPNNTEEYINTVDLSNQSAVSSGNYQRYYEYEGKRYHHIIDNKTLFPANYNKGVTVVTNSSLEGDIYSTALFILPYEEGANLAKQNNIKALWITSDDKEYETDNFTSPK